MKTIDRSQFIGASECAAVFDRSPWLTSYELWREKTGKPMRKRFSESMRWGTLLEPVVLQHFCDANKAHLKKPLEPLYSEEYDWMAASPDGICTIPGVSDLIYVEVKTTNFMAYKKNTWGMDGTDEVPPDYLLQIQHGLAVTGLQRAYLPLLIDGITYKEYSIDRNDELIEMIIDGEREFWGMVKSKQAPEIDWNHKRIEEIAPLIWEPIPGKVKELPKEIAELAAEFIANRDRIKELNDRNDYIKIQLLKEIEDASLALAYPKGLPTIELARKKLSRAGFTVKPTEYTSLNVKFTK